VGGAVSTANKRILLVDDNHDILDLLEVYLYRDYEIATALNGFEGLNKAKEELPDCVITDIMMPVMDGIKFYNSLRKQAGGAGIPVIGMTSFVRKVSRKSLLNMGFFRVLSKPLGREAVRRAVEEALGAAQEETT
jgi:CheY-like chemotaxis protein